jgi:hypothetical protein
MHLLHTFLTLIADGSGDLVGLIIEMIGIAIEAIFGGSSDTNEVQELLRFF